MKAEEQLNENGRYKNDERNILNFHLHILFVSKAEYLNMVDFLSGSVPC